jgi:hypothetical protein
MKAYFVIPYGRQKPSEDLTGQRFGLVTVIAPAQSVGTGARYRCRCECGAVRYCLGSHLRTRPPKTHRDCQPATDPSGTRA